MSKRSSKLAQRITDFKDEWMDLFEKLLNSNHTD